MELLELLKQIVPQTDPSGTQAMAAGLGHSYVPRFENHHGDTVMSCTSWCPGSNG